MFIYSFSLHLVFSFFFFSKISRIHGRSSDSLNKKSDSKIAQRATIVTMNAIKSHRARTNEIARRKLIARSDTRHRREIELPANFISSSFFSLFPSNPPARGAGALRRTPIDRSITRHSAPRHTCHGPPISVAGACDSRLRWVLTIF